MNQNEDAQKKGDQVAEPDSVADLRKVIQERRLTKDFLDTEEFRGILTGLRETVRNGSQSGVWSSLAVMGRAASVSKPMGNIFFPIVEQRVDAGLPRFDGLLLQDGDDRWYLAKALQRNPSPEVVEIAFSEIVRDDLGEKARRVWVEVGLAAVETRDEFLKRINGNIDLLFGSVRDRSDTLARRIRRINSAISEKLITSDLPAGSEFSHQLRILYTGHLSEEGPEDRRLRDEAALELMASLTNVVRLSFAAASDPSSYFIAPDLRRWRHPASPPLEFESNSSGGDAGCHRRLRSGI